MLVFWIGFLTAFVRSRTVVYVDFEAWNLEIVYGCLAGLFSLSTAVRTWRWCTWVTGDAKQWATTVAGTGRFQPPTRRIRDGLRSKLWSLLLVYAEYVVLDTGLLLCTAVLAGIHHKTQLAIVGLLQLVVVDGLGFLYPLIRSAEVWQPTPLASARTEVNWSYFVAIFAIVAQTAILGSALWTIHEEYDTVGVLPTTGLAVLLAGNTVQLYATIVLWTHPLPPAYPWQQLATHHRVARRVRMIWYAHLVEHVAVWGIGMATLALDRAVNPEPRPPQAGLWITPQ